MKDLKSSSYWRTFGELGPNIGMAHMPTPQEAAETVITLMRERDDLREALKAEAQARSSLHARMDTFLMSVANLADEARGSDNTATVANTAKILANAPS